MKQRPVGLVVFAVINFVFAAYTVLAFVMMFLVKGLMAQSGLSLKTYTVLSPFVTSLFLILSGIGFLKLSYCLGFIGGLVFCFGSLANILVFNALRGFQGFAPHIPSMIYPIVLLAFLTLRYKRYFKNEQDTEPPSAPDSE